MIERVKNQLKSLKDFLDLVNEMKDDSNEMNGYARAFYGVAYDLNLDEVIVDVESKAPMMRLKIKWLQLGILAELESNGSKITDKSKNEIKDGFLRVAEECYVYTYNKHKDS